MNDIQVPARTGLDGLDIKRLRLAMSIANRRNPKAMTNPETRIKAIAEVYVSLVRRPR